MSEGVCFCLGVAAAGVIILLSYGSCIFPEDIEKAVPVCQQNEGVAYVTQDFGGTNQEIFCNNGARFSWNKVVTDKEHDDIN